jgi:hypothetical protein
MLRRQSSERDLCTSDELKEVADLDPLFVRCATACLAGAR